MTEGEKFISEFLDDKKIKFRKQALIEGLYDDSKCHRVADFYLPKYKIYIEYNGQWNLEPQKERYLEKRKAYIKNQIPCVFLYPENLGIITYIFPNRMVYVMKKYKMEKELKKYRWKMFKDSNLHRLLALLFFAFLIAISNPWNSNKGLVVAGLGGLFYQLNLLYSDYRKLFIKQGILHEYFDK
jgi:hypothetical protein